MAINYSPQQQQPMTPLPAPTQQPMLQPMPELNTLQRIGYGLMGANPFADYDYNLRAANAQALINRTAAETAGMEDALRRQQADDAALDLIFRSRGIGPEKGRALLRQQDMEAALAQQQMERQRVTMLGLQIAEAKKTPLQRETEQWEALFGGLQGALKNVFGSPEEMQDYAHTTQAIQMASKAEQYDKDQVVEGLMSQVRTQVGAVPGASPFDDSHRKDARALLDSLLTKGVDANTARQWVGESLASSIGIEASPMPISQEYLLAQGEKVQRNAATPEQITTIRDYINRQAAGAFNTEPPNPNLKATLAKYGVASDADLQRLSRDKADRFIRSVIRREKLRPVGLSEFLQAIGLSNPVQPTSIENLP